MSKKASVPALDRSVLGRLRIMPRFLRDRTVATWKKGAIVAGMLYIISPVDAIPELVVPMIGWLDDVGVLGLTLTWLMRELDRYAVAVNSATIDTP